eukprot:3139284-Pyramimonas_sp.AAC.1
MSVLLEAVDKDFHAQPGIFKNKPYVVTNDVLYADDTLLVAQCPESLQRHFHIVSNIGKTFGLDLNAGKTLLLKIRSHATVLGPNGEEIQSKDDVVYLGGLLSAD